MKVKIAELFDSFKERFSNPLIFSFLCYWILYNWKIALALFWYDPDQLPIDSSIYSFIENQLASCKSWSIPLTFAVIYTALMPILRTFIKVFYSRINKWGENWNLQILSGSQVSIDKYLKLRQNLVARTKLLENVIRDESQYRSKFEDMKTQLIEAQSTLESNKAYISHLQGKMDESDNLGMISGKWLNNYQRATGENGTEEIEIQGNNYIVLSSFGQKETKYLIKDFRYKSDNKEVFFVKESIKENDLGNGKVEKELLINRLRIENADTLVGTENLTTSIEYKKK